MVCSHCGAPISAGERVCSYCNCEVELKEVKVQKETQQPQNQPVQPIQVVINNAVETKPSPPTCVTRTVARVSPKSKPTALILCVFLGYIGIHRFYVGKNTSGIVYIFTFGVFGFGWIYDIIMIALGKFTDSCGLPLVK